MGCVTRCLTALGSPLWFLLFAANAAAFQHQQTQGPARLEARSNSDRPALALTDLLRVTITVAGTKELSVETPVRPAAGSPWELLEKSAVVATPSADGVRWHQALTLAPTAPGDSQVLLTPLVYRDGQDEHRIEWQPFTVSVRTQLTDVNWRRARDITSIEESPAPPPRASWAWLWLSLPFMLMVLSGLWLVRRRRAQPQPASALTKAMRECDRILAMQLPEKNHAKSFIVLLTGVVRRYLERRFDLSARRQTSAELLSTVDARTDLDADAKRWLHAFFEETDLVKFAGAAVSVERCRTLAAQVRQFCHATSPKRA